MKKLPIILFILMTLGQFSFGQESKTLEDLKKMKNDTNKVILLNKLAWENRKNDSLSSLYALKAKEISESISFDKGLATSLMRLGDLEKNNGNYEKAAEYYLESLGIEEKNNHIYGIVRAKIQLGKIYQKKEEYYKALDYSKEARTLCTTIENDTLLASIHGTIASIYSSLDSFDAALGAHLKSIGIRKELNDEKNLARSYLNIGVLYNKLGEKEKALEYLNKSKLLYEKFDNKPALSKVYIGLGVNYVTNKKLDSALSYYNKSLDIKNTLNLKNKEIAYNNIGAVYEEKNQFRLAEKYYLKSIELAERRGNEKQLLTSYYNLGRLRRKEKKYTKALNYLTKSLELCYKYKKDIRRLDLYITIAETYESLKDFKSASLYNEKHIVLRDSVDIKYRAANVIEIEYEKEKNKNALLEKEQEISQQKNLKTAAENSRKTMLLYFLAVGTLLLIVLFFAILYAYRSRKAKELAEKNRKIAENNQKIAEKNQKIAIQKNIELLKKQELKSIKAMINGRENERKRIAQDLHDRLGSMLSMVKLHYKSVEDDLDKLKKENKKQYSQANALLDEACNAVREIAHNMVSGVLTKFGLIAALEDLKNTLEGTNTFQIELITHGLDDRLENTLEMELYGIVQELIHNIIKHAKAEEVSVQLLKRTNEINLTVIDDGIGFDMSEERSGMGLKSIASRVDALKGTLQIDSGRGNGTTITIDIPV